MDFFSSCVPDQVSLYYYVVVAVCVIGALYINDMFSKMGSYRSYGGKQLTSYGYDNHNGPSLWKNLFEAAKGQKQSPINLITSCAIAIPSELNPLKFSEQFHHTPYEMKMYNSGLNAVLYAKWSGLMRPSISGGPLEREVYNFLNVRFRWGADNHEGSEHMVDTKRYAVEMQVAFMRNGENPKCDLLDAALAGDLLMLSYLFMVTPVDNPYLEPIIQALKNLKFPMSCALLCPFPLRLLTPLFSKNYFYYEGSLTFPPCTEGVKWIVQPEPLLISSRQVNKFRKLGACNCAPIVSNSRPVQMPNGREIFYYD